MQARPRLVSPRIGNDQRLILARLTLYDEVSNYDGRDLRLQQKPGSPPGLIRNRFRRAFGAVISWIGETGIKYNSTWRKAEEFSWQEWMRDELAEEALVIPLLLVTFSCA